MVRHSAFSIRLSLFSWAALCSLAFQKLPAGEVRAATPEEFRRALSKAGPGSVIRLAPGRYDGGFHARGLAGTAAMPLVIEAEDPKSPPVFTSAETALHLASPSHLQLRNLVIQNLSANGINVDDTGGQPARHLVIQGVRFSAIGERGNQDALKLSGVENFEVRECRFSAWGAGGGSAIDMVGCHRGVIEDCSFADTPGQQSNGVQAKGGSADIAIRKNSFAQTGGRGINLGGNTGTAFFRPPLDAAGGNAEARNLRVEGNTFSGTLAPIVFAGVDGAVVRFNTLDNPGRWAIRILQENTAEGFVPCRNGTFTDNRIIFQSTSWSSGGVNIGAGTAPATFSFARNWWHCSDRPDQSRPRLPTSESDGAYGKGEKAGLETAGASSWKSPP